MDFYKRPVSYKLARTFHDQLRKDFPTASPDEIEAAVTAFLDILRQELATIPEMMEKLRTEADLYTARHTREIVQSAQGIGDGIGELVSAST